LKIVSDASCIEALLKVSEYDFNPGNEESFKLFSKVYKDMIDIRGSEQLTKDYENILQTHAEYFTKVQNGRKTKENFYKGLKHLSKKMSLKAFNREVMSRIDGIFSPDFHPNDLLEENMPEFENWKKNSKPFNFLVTCCDLITAIKDSKDNTTINICLEMIFKETDGPIQFRILVIQLVSHDILSEHIKVSHQNIIEMISLFEQFDSRSRMITDKYMKKPLTDQDKMLIRHALKEALTCGIIRG
jgi:hypothetical protein